jgi:hypothetical protein
MIENFEDRWRGLIDSGDTGTREVDAASPIRMVCGVDASLRPLFFIIVEHKPGLPRLSGAISVERRQRTLDGKWTLTLILNDATLTDVFLSLVGNLAVHCAAAESESAAVDAFLTTVEEWQELLSARFDRLSEERLRGLIAELWFGFESGHHGYSMAETVSAWSGPFRGEQDFNFPTPGVQYEVKAIRPNRESVEISSIAQLDQSNVQLAVVTLDLATDPAIGTTLPQQIARIRASFAEPEARAEFNRRFAQLMVNLTDPWYDDQCFQIQRLRLFDAGPQFPALRGTELPQAIPRARYRLDLAQVTGFLLVDKMLDASIPEG